MKKKNPLSYIYTHLASFSQFFPFHFLIIYSRFRQGFSYLLSGCLFGWQKEVLKRIFSSKKTHRQKYNVTKGHERGQNTACAYSRWCSSLKERCQMKRRRKTTSQSDSSQVEQVLITFLISRADENCGCAFWGHGTGWFRWGKKAHLCSSFVELCKEDFITFPSLNIYVVIFTCLMSFVLTLRLHRLCTFSCKPLKGASVHICSAG